MAKNKNIIVELSSEEKIKEAARRVFIKKGFSATRTRDIAEEAGINLALLNYYFRSKQKLFDLIMMETFGNFISGLKPIFFDESNSLDEKLNLLAEKYIIFLKANPDLPLFMINEIHNNPDKLLNKTGMKKNMKESHFFKQIQSKSAGKINPVHLIMNMLGLIVLPFIASPLIKHIGSFKQAEFDQLMEERKKLIPLWFNSMLNTK